MKVLNTTNKIKLGKNWKDYEVPGTVFDTNYGALTLIKAERKIHIAKSGKQYKYMYYTVTDGQKQFEITRQQLFNKKLPKTATVQTTLMLAQPKDPLDTVVSEVENMCNIKCKQNDIIDQCIFICNNLRNDSCTLNRYKRYLLSSYHPDSASGYADTNIFKKINFIFNF